MKDPVTVCKAKTILEKALAQDEMYIQAVYLLAEIYEQVLHDCILNFCNYGNYAAWWALFTELKEKNSLGYDMSHRSNSMAHRIQTFSATFIVASY